MIIEDLDDCRDALKKYLQKAGPVCFFTGAGISTPSGIPDFRSPGGIWSHYRIIEYGEFLQSEQARLEDWQRRFHMARLFREAEPNAAHRFVAHSIEKGMSVGVITQNIDGLHQRALNSANVEAMTVEFHGTGAYAHCLSCREEFDMVEMGALVEREQKAPCCSCGGYIKAAVISFGENVPEILINRAIMMIDSAKSVIVIGSSLQGWPASGLLQRALERGASLCILNREATGFDRDADLVLRANAAEITHNIDAFAEEAQGLAIQKRNVDCS